MAPCLGRGPVSTFFSQCWDPVWLVPAQVLRVLLQFLGVHVNISSVASGRHCVLAVTHYLSLNLSASLSWQVPEPWGLGFEEDVPLRLGSTHRPVVVLSQLPSTARRQGQTFLSVSQPREVGQAVWEEGSVRTFLSQSFSCFFISLETESSYVALDGLELRPPSVTSGAGITSVCRQPFLL